MTEEVSIRELKARLSHYLRRVQQGERFVVTSRGKTIAELNPAVPADRPEHIRKLIEAGLIVPARRSMRNLPDPIPLLPGEKSMVDYVREQRR